MLNLTYIRSILDSDDAICYGLPVEEANELFSATLALAGMVACDHRWVLRRFPSAEHVLTWDEVCAPLGKVGASNRSHLASLIGRARSVGVIADAGCEDAWTLTPAGRLAWEERQRLDRELDEEAP